MHIYDCSDTDNPFLSDETSIKSIRKSKYLFPSVTTILKVIPNPFLQEWVVKKCISLGREHPEKDIDEVRDLAWGQVATPDGDIVSSSSFGTQAHYALEQLFLDSVQPEVLSTGDSWRDFVMDAYHDIIDKGIKNPEPEVLILDTGLRVAGMIDLLAMINGKYVLMDYKFRSCDGTGKFYDSDCYQLSIESFFVQQKYNLDYLPKICSICIDNKSGRAYFKWWSQKKLDRGIQVFLDARDLYFTINNLD